ncbi:DUF3048 domain-containing protein [Candidatus Roizmanbacteria bacterium]|nr:DUF3048 domain-containing protein [Candidatus Roizmanbacteria bacterium]
MKKPVFITITVAIFIVTTLVSYLIFSSSSQTTSGGNFSKSAKKVNEYEAIVFDSAASKTEECPINGAMYSKEQKSWWEQHRPLGIMIENHHDARPQSGINAADVTYEAVAEGGITRTLNVYYCQDAGIVGPVRSARTYFLDFISEYGSYPLYAHVGGANTPGPADALGQIADYGWNQYNDLNQFSIGFPTFKRDESRLGREVATEHTMYSTTSKLWEVGAQRGLTNKDKKGQVWDESFVKYSFKDDPALSQRPAAQSVHVDFWDDPAYAVDWIYRKETNDYARKNGGDVHVDRNTNQQLTAKNIVVLLMKEARANDGYEDNIHMIYGTKGTGKAYIFMDGKEIKGTWKKADREARTILTDSNGDEVKFIRGKIWFEIQPLDAVITVK